MNTTTLKTLLLWFTGLWAFGLGLRMSLELILADQFIQVPNYLVNIYFDFVPLAILGLITTVIGTKELFKKVVKEKEVK